jgi:hypothetical protein
MLGIVEAPVQNRGRHGKTRLISLDKHIDKIENGLLDDPVFISLK